MQKSIGKLMPLGIDFEKDFGGFLEEKWRHVGTKIESKIDVIFEQRFFKKPYFLKEKPRFLRSSRSKLEAKIDKNSMPKTMAKQKGSETQL